MSKGKFICSKCGYESTKWLGKCPACGSWSSFEEKPEIRKKFKDKTRKSTLVKLEEVSLSHLERIKFKSSQLNQFFGEGIAKGSVILFAGEPGIGKSTFLLQLKNLLKNNVKVLYISGEETEYQVAERAKRLNVKDILFLPSTSLEEIIDIINRDYDIIIVDSVQTIASEEIESPPGSVSQVKTVAEKIVEISKTNTITTILVGHVTKEGAIAGPKILEHIVDVVIYLEGDRTSPLRFLKCLKNRFGPTGNVVVFEMTSSGLSEIENPSYFFIAEKREEMSGSTLATIVEGNRSFIIEIQALVSPALYSSAARRIASMYDVKRLNLILAIMEKRLSMNFSAMDVYVNIPGGIFVKDTATDLAVACAIYSSFTDTPVPSDTVIVGEVGLGSEIRAVKDIDIRIKEAEALGFKKILIPEGNRINIKNTKIEIVRVSDIRKVLEILFGF